MVKLCSVVNLFVFAFQGNNDDLILDCCTHYCKDKARDFMPKDKGNYYDYTPSSQFVGGRWDTLFSCYPSICPSIMFLSLLWVPNKHCFLAVS